MSSVSVWRSGWSRCVAAASPLRRCCVAAAVKQRRAYVSRRGRDAICIKQRQAFQRSDTVIGHFKAAQSLNKKSQQRLEKLTFSWDLETFPLWSRSSAVKACQMDLRSSSRRAMLLKWQSTLIFSSARAECVTFPLFSSSLWVCSASCGLGEGVSRDLVELRVRNRDARRSSGAARRSQQEAGEEVKPAHDKRLQKPILDLIVFGARKHSFLEIFIFLKGYVF